MLSFRDTRHCQFQLDYYSNRGLTARRGTGRVFISHNHSMATDSRALRSLSCVHITVCFVILTPLVSRKPNFSGHPARCETFATLLARNHTMGSLCATKVFMQYIKRQSVPHRTQSQSIIVVSALVLFREAIGVCCES